jgi:hypothetical protein
MFDRTVVDRNDLLRGLHSAFCLVCVLRSARKMSMRDQYQTKAAEFQARALCESNQMTRHHFDTMAKDYLQLAELATQIDSLNNELPKIANSDRKQ